MPEYRLTYFDVRARAETARQLFALAGVAYTDRRLTKEEWGAIKNETPFDQIPILEVDGKPLAQSHSINRYLAKQFGFAGASDWESARIDSLGDQYEDFFRELLPFIAVVAGRAQGDTQQLYKDVVVPARDKFFTILTKFLKENPSGYLVGAKVSWVDLLLAEHVATFGAFAEDYAKDFKEVSAHCEFVRSLPELKKWLETRPETQF